MSDTAMASNPGRLKVQWPVFLRCFPKWPVIYVLAIPGAAILGMLMGQPRLLPVLPLILFVLALLGLQKLKEQFWNGDVNPARVVSVNPPTIAVLGDLTTRHGLAWHVVKVIRVPQLRAARGGVPPVGSPLATVAVYWGNSGTSHWDDFDPQIVNCVTDSQPEIQRVLSSIAPQSWTAGCGPEAGAGPHTGNP